MVQFRAFYQREFALIAPDDRIAAIHALSDIPLGPEAILGCAFRAYEHYVMKPKGPFPAWKGSLRVVLYPFVIAMPQGGDYQILNLLSSCSFESSSLILTVDAPLRFLIAHLGSAKKPPSSFADTTGTPRSFASFPIPGIIRSVKPATQRCPSGKIPTDCPFRTLCIIILTDAASLTNLLFGMEPIADIK
jgi:hypothetical protein